VPLCAVCCVLCAAQTVEWGRISMVDAERRLLARALLDPGNTHFVLLSEACIPISNFSFVAHCLRGSALSFVQAWGQPGGEEAVEPRV